MWVGHLVLPTTNLNAAWAFWTAIGMRPIEHNEDVAILELRGGTHLILTHQDASAQGEGIPFDLMVDDIEATYMQWDDCGLGPSPIQQGRNHQFFLVRDPDGRELRVHSSHVVGVV